IEGDKLRGSAKIERIEGRGTEAWRDREWEGERVSTHQVGACRVQQADDVSVDTILTHERGRGRIDRDIDVDRGAEPGAELYGVHERARTVRIGHDTGH